MNPIKSYLHSLVDPDMVPTGLKVAAIVGTALFAINHGSALTSGKMNRGRWISAGLSYLVPYLVSIHGQHTSNDRDRNQPNR